jgi:Ca2+:H+ antiporter
LTKPSAIGFVHHRADLADLAPHQRVVLLLTLTITSIEVVAISAVVRHGGPNPTLMRDTLLALIMIIMNGMVTIPSVLVINHLIERPVVLGVEHTDLALLILTLALSMITFTSGRTNMLQGVVHLLLFAAYILLIFQA